MSPSRQRRQAAIVDGRKVIEKFNCNGCHTLEMERWDSTTKPSDFGKPPKVADYDYPFLASFHADGNRAGSQGHRPPRPTAGDARRHAADRATRRQAAAVDEDGAPIEAGDTTSKVF